MPGLQGVAGAVDGVRSKADKEIKEIESLVEESAWFVQVLNSPVFKDYLASPVTLGQAHGRWCLLFKVSKDCPFYSDFVIRDQTSNHVALDNVRSINHVREQLDTVAKCQEFREIKFEGGLEPCLVVTNSTILTVTPVLEALREHQLTTGDIL